MSYPKNLVIVFMGRPGSGKGTQAKRLAGTLHKPYFSTGDTFRSLVVEDSPLGTLVRTTINAGRLMPHWFASYIVQHFVLTLPMDVGAVIDGSNRTLPEAQLFDEYMTWLGRPYVIAYLDVSEETVAQRILARAAKGSGREDDTERTIRCRVEEFNNHTRIALEYMDALNKVVTISGEQPVEVVEADLRRIFGSA